MLKRLCRGDPSGSRQGGRQEEGEGTRQRGWGKVCSGCLPEKEGFPLLR